MIASWRNHRLFACPGPRCICRVQSMLFPFALMHNLKHNKVLHERVICLTCVLLNMLYVHNVRRVQIEQSSPTFWRVVASHGWREMRNVEEVFHRCGLARIKLPDDGQTSFFMSHAVVDPRHAVVIASARQAVLAAATSNALRAPDHFAGTANRVIGTGVLRSKSNARRLLSP
ncbi:KUP/HAK/KT family potassium transporter [Escherichia coli]